MRGMVQLLTALQAAARLAVSRRTFFTLAAQPDFPRPVRITARCVRWKEEDIAHWVERRAA